MPQFGASGGFVGFGQADDGMRVGGTFDGQLHSWHAITEADGLDADKFLARLCALVPPPNFHMVRYFGVFASHHHLRPRVVPGRDAEGSRVLCRGLHDLDSP